MSFTSKIWAVAAATALIAVLSAGAVFSGHSKHPGFACFLELDKNKDDQLSKEEFTNHYGPESQKQFSEADLDKSGSLSHSEYHGFLKGRHP